MEPLFYVSARRSLGNDNQSSSRLRVYEAPVDRFGPEDPRIRRASAAEVIARTQGKRVVCLVHGYANPIEDVSAAYARIVRHLARHDPYDEVVAYTWPASRSRVRWWKARRNSENVDRGFVYMCQNLGARCLDVITHSLGARVVLSGLDEVGATSTRARRLRNLFLMAPAIDDISLQNGEEFFEATAQCERVFVLHSRHDGVLRVAYQVGDAAEALGLFGPDSLAACRVNVHSVDCSRALRSHGPMGSHGAYKKSAAVFDYVARACATRRMPREERL